MAAHRSFLDTPGVDYCPIKAMSPGANLKGMTQAMSNKELWLLKLGRRNLLQAGVSKEILDVFPSLVL